MVPFKQSNVFPMLSRCLLSRGQRSRVFGDRHSSTGYQYVKLFYLVKRTDISTYTLLDLSEYSPERSLYLAKRSLSTIYTGSHSGFLPSMALDFFPRLLSSCIVALVEQIYYLLHFKKAIFLVSLRVKMVLSPCSI